MQLKLLVFKNDPAPAKVQRIWVSLQGQSEKEMLLST